MHLRFSLVVGLLAASAAWAQPKPVVYRGATLLSAAGAPIERGVLVLAGGKITAMGGPDTPIPDDAEVIDATGKTIIPGLVDTHSHIGIWQRPFVPAHEDGNEGSGPVHPALRAMDAIYPDDASFRMALAGGVTTANIMPGSGNVIGGQTLYVKLRGSTIEAMRILGRDGVVGGLKMANGENPKRFNFDRRKVAPATRMKIAALQREQFVKARDYQRSWAAHRKAKAAGKDAPPPETDLSLEPLVEAIERKRTVHFHCHRADDLMSALRLADEFGFEIVLQHGTEGYRIPEELRKRDVGVSLTLIDSPGGKPEVFGMLEETAAFLTKAGVNVAINTDDMVTESRFFLRTGAIAVRGGLSEADALKALTINGARMLHLDHRVGTLERGKDADFVILSGPPFSVYTQVLTTVIEGVPVFDRGRESDWAYQTGGFALRDRAKLPRPALAVQGPGPASAPAGVGRKNAAPGAANRVAVLAGRIHTVGAATVRDGVVLIENGKIAAVGPRNAFEIPADAQILTAAVVTPGLIDCHTVVGLSGGVNVTADQDQDEMSDPNQAELRVLDGYNPNEPLVDFLRSQGVTVLHGVPGRNNVIAGQTGVFRTTGTTADRATLRFPAGLLVNLGEIPKGAYNGKLPTTRMGTASLVRTALAQAQNHAAKRAAAKSDDKKPPANPKLDALTLALERKIPVLFAAHRADDLQTALRIAREFNLDARLELATEAYLMADSLAAHNVPVVLHPAMQRPGSMETFNSILGNAAVLAEKKVPFALGTGFEGYVPKTRVLRQEAAIAMVNGLGYERALRAITLDAARLLGIGDRFGSLEPGKVADLVLYDGDPFEYATHVTHTLQDGRVTWDRSEYLKLPLARRAMPLVGGGGVGCCLGLW